MIAHIILNTDIEYNLDKKAYYIAVDGGYNTLFKQNIKPKVIIGDLDSVDLNSMPKDDIDIVKFEREKDFSDSEAAIEYVISKNIKEIVIHGISGGRLDHILCNVALTAYAGSKGIKVKGITHDNKSEIFYYRKGLNSFKCQNGATITVFPIKNSVIKDSINLYYPYNQNIKLAPLSPSRGLSNICLSNSFSINVIKGEGVVIINKN